MKSLFVLLLFTAFSFQITAQSNSKTKEIPSQSVVDRSWNLEKYLWSHCHAIGTVVENKLDFDAIYNWQSVADNDKDLAISPDGNFIAYNVVRGSSFKYQRHEALFVQEINGPWKRDILKIESGFFSGDSKQYIFKTNDSLGFLKLGESVTYVPGVISYNYIAQNKPKWLAYQLGNEKSTLILRNLFTGKDVAFDSVNNYVFDHIGAWLIYHTKSQRLVLHSLLTDEEKAFPDVAQYILKGNIILILSSPKIDEQGISLQYANLSDNTLSTIWSDTTLHCKIMSSAFDESGEQISFLVAAENTSEADRSIWYYKKGMAKATIRLNRQMLHSDSDFKIVSTTFNSGGKYIMFAVEKDLENKPVLEACAVKMDIWNYKDSIIRSARLFRQDNIKTYIGFVSVAGGPVAFLENDFERLNLSKDEFLLKRSIYSSRTDRYWETKKVKDSNYLINLREGTVFPLPVRWNENESKCFFFTPDARYLVYFDQEKHGNYFSFDLESHKLINLTASIPKGHLIFSSPGRIGQEKSIRRAGTIGWRIDENALLVYDNYDIWELDYTGSRKPVSITNGYGRRNHINLYLDDEQFYDCKFSKGSVLLLHGFNTLTKQQEIYRLTVGSNKDPQRLISANCRFQDLPRSLSNEMEINRSSIKPANKDVWIVKRESASEAPNYFYTTDFGVYRQITDVSPNRHFNWHTTELHSFKCLDGKKGEGILYKPGNFDPHKKYPVLIVFYSQIEDHLNKFQHPDYISSGVAPAYNPAWLLSNDYLIFVPSMKTAPLKYGPIALNVIEGAVKYLKKFSYVDGRHIGGSAHSWSAKLGAYVFNHSKSFAAMCLSEGFLYANMISVAFSTDGLRENGESRLKEVEENFEFGNLWSNKSSWLDQTTVLNVNKSTSPLLLYCGKLSSAEYKNQTTQFFTALRRLEKKAWWLEYTKGGHTISDSNELKDFTIRYTQYFDHYLKEAPAPRWMTQSMPSSLKDIDRYLELDPSGTCAYSKESECKICNTWNEKYKNNPEMFQKPIAEWK